MPNIEICGAGKGIEQLYGRIRQLFEDAYYGEDIVITIPGRPADVRNLRGESERHLRLYVTHTDDWPRIVARLDPLELRIEVVRLEANIPPASKREKG